MPEQPSERAAQAKRARALVAEAIEETDQAARGLVERLLDICQLTEETKAAASGTASVLERLERMNAIRVEVEDVRDLVTGRFERASRCREAVEGIALEVRHLTSSIRTIRELAERNYLLSINASVEAARAKQDGTGFGVVAKEVRDQACVSQMVADELEDGVASIHHQIQDHFRQSPTEFAEERRTMTRVVDRVAEMLAVYEKMNTHQAAALALLEAKSAALSALLLEAIGVIQFQDVVRQRLEAVEPLLTRLGGDEAPPVEDGYSMVSQRRAHHEITGELADQVDAEGPDIELF